jgi:DNA (cytosine-5)-methyltransferase 1
MNNLNNKMNKNILINSKKRILKSNIINEEKNDSTLSTIKQNLIVDNEQILDKINIDYIDLCCGIGGFRIAINNFQKKSNYNFNCVMSADIKDDALKTYNINFKENNEKINIFDIDKIPPFNLLCAGFPCQPFSSAGQKKGFEDTRGGIIFKIIDICKKYTPKYVILENVSNLISLNNGKSIERICKEFKDIDYNVSYKKLNAIFFGVPQNRERVFIICSYKNNINFDKLKNINENIKLKDIIDNNSKYTDIDENFAKKILNLHLKTPLFGYKMQDKRGGKYNIHSWDIGINGDISIDEKKLMNNIMTERRKKHWADKKKIDWMDGMPLTYDEIKSFYDIPNLKSMLDNLVKKKYLKIEKPKKLVENKRIYDDKGLDGYNICKGKLSFPITNILDPDSVAPTLTATDSNKLAIIIDNKFIRKLTDNEIKELCGFSKSYILPNNVDKYDLFGNTVVPQVVEAVLECIF